MTRNDLTWTLWLYLQFHSKLPVRRTLLYGGVAMNPRSHLRLIYEGNPLGFLAEQAILYCLQMLRD